MDAIRITGGNPLFGSISISGAKNAALPLMAAGLLTDQPLTLQNVPDLMDIRTMAALLHGHGAAIAFHDDECRITTERITDTVAPYDIVRKMRASVLVLGPLVARVGHARVSLPGGCAIGTRPVDLHMRGLQQLGADITLTDGYIEARAPDGLRGAPIVLPFASVGATENLLMAAALAKGETVLENAAREPEIVDLAHCLIAMGAEIDGAGTDKIHIQGKSSLHGAVHRVIPDRIETGTYAMAVAAAGGEIVLENTDLQLLDAAAAALQQAGVTVAAHDGGLTVSRNGRPLVGTDITTQPFPGFPTDLQAQFMAAMTVAKGAAMITETIFENRFMHVPELRRMGADIHIKGGTAMVRGVDKLLGAPVMATDLRASVSLVLAGLAAEGDTTIGRVYHLDRGYDCLESKLAACGAAIQRIKA